MSNTEKFYFTRNEFNNFRNRSTLGSVLLVLNVNDLPTYIETYIILYADDSNVCISTANNTDLRNKLSQL